MKTSAISRFCLAAICTLTISQTALAQSGLQHSPDGQRTLVSKNFGAERWAIGLNPDDTVTGNVFSPGGGAPQFVWCETVRVRRGQRELECFGASRCLAAPCSAASWNLIGNVMIDEAFFEPPKRATGAAGSTPRESVPRTLEAAAGAPLASTSGLQVTPDGKLVLVSKDVGSERWAIARDRADGTITGNVFARGGGPPRFVWCEPKAETPAGGDPLVLACFAADRCAAAPCREEEWAFVADVSLAAAFFEEPVCGDGATQPGEVCDDGNTSSTDGCTNACELARCGDSIVQPTTGEQCDDGNANDLDACSNACKIARCGDSIVQTGEECDDGNRNDADSCTNDCRHSSCGDGICRANENCATCGQDCGTCDCMNIAGDWSYSERGTVNCGSDIGSFNAGGQGNATIEQSGCDVKITVAAQDVQFMMRGTVSGSSIHVTGPLYYADLIDLPPGVDVRDDGWTWDGTAGSGGFRLNGTGAFRVAYAGRTVASCSVSSRHDFDR